MTNNMNSNTSNNNQKKDLKNHWNKAYDRKSVDQLGQYENFPQPSLQLIEECNFYKDAVILNVGASTT